MTSIPPTQPPGWYYAQGDPPGTQRYWDGATWQGGPQAVPGAEGAGTGAHSKASLPSPWLRLLARIIDFLIILIPALIIGAILGVGAVGGLGTGSTDGASIVASLVIGLISLGYEYFFLAKDGATPGKKIMSIKVVLEDGSPLGSDGALRRLILSAVGIVPIIGGIVGLVVLVGTVVMIFIDDLRQVPADKVAKSIVIKA